MPTRILICDDHQLFREGLRSLLATDPDLEVIGEAANGREAVEKARALNPNIVIMDMVMPEMNGSDATQAIVSAMPEVSVLALSMSANMHDVERAFEAGAKGYLLKDCAFEEISQAIAAVLSKLGYVSPKIFPVVAERFQKKGSSIAPAAPVLSTREREVLKLIAEGQTTKTIAHMLHLSVKTVESHRQNLMSKLNIYSVAELTKYAIRTGLTTVDL